MKASKQTLVTLISMDLFVSHWASCRIVVKTCVEYSSAFVSFSPSQKNPQSDYHRIFNALTRPASIGQSVAQGLRLMISESQNINHLSRHHRTPERHFYEL